jgi:hypothetical protein
VVLLDRPYYRNTLKPLLAKWMLLWLRTKHMTGVEDAVALQYLEKGTSYHFTLRHTTVRRLSHRIARCLPSAVSLHYRARLTCGCGAVSHMWVWCSFSRPEFASRAPIPQ